MPPPDATGGAEDPADVGQGCKYHVISVAESDRSVLFQILAFSCFNYILWIFEHSMCD